MNRVQFLDSLRRQLEDLPSRQREEIIEVYSARITERISQGATERDAVEQMGAPAVCVRDARAGRLPAASGSSAASSRRSSNPFEPQMAARPQRIQAQKLEREQRRPEEPHGKVPWALVIAVTLAALLCIGFVLLRVLSSDGNLGYTAREQSFDLSQIQSIVVEDSDCDIRVSALTSSDVRANYYEGHHTSYTLSLEGGTLYIRSQTDRKWYDTLLSLYDSTVPVLNLYLPPSFCGSLRLCTDNGDIELLGTLELSDLSLVSSNGSLSLTDLQLYGALNAATTNASITMESIRAASITLSSCNGSLYLQDIDSASLTAATTNGTIEVYDLSRQMQSIDLETSNASVLGRIIGQETDFSIAAETSNSRNNLHNRSGGTRDLRIRTSNGTIHVDFVAD